MSRVDELIETLGLAPHPEGGFYHEIWRSPLGERPKTLEAMCDALPETKELAYPLRSRSRG